MFTKGNDIVVLQQTSPAIVSAGEGNDRYILDSEFLAPNQKITISDTKGSNTLHLVGGLTITGSQVTNNALLLTLSNGAEVTLLGADTFQFLTGGSLKTKDAQTFTFSDFVTKGLGYTAVPAPGNVAQSTTPVTVNNTGGTSGGGSGGTSGGGTGGGATGNVITVPTSSGNKEVAGTAGRDIFTFDVATALADASGQNTQVTINGFTTGTTATSDVLRLDLPTANSEIKTLAQLNGQQGVFVQVDPFGNSTLINFGNDANGGQPVTITLAGIVDPAQVAVEVV